MGEFLQIAFNDFDEMAEAGGEWDQEYLKPVPGTFLGSDDQILGTNMELSYTSFEPGIFVRGSAPKDRITIGVQTGGPAAIFRGQQLEQDQALLLTSSGEVEFLSNHPCSLIIFGVETKLFEQYYRDIVHTDKQFANGFDAVTLKNKSWGKLLGTQLKSLIDETAATPTHLESSDFMSNIRHQAMSAVMESMSPSQRMPKSTERRRGAKRAEAYLREHAIDPITLQQLCKEIGLGKRALQIGFKEYYKMSLMYYLKLRRLHGIRKELMKTDLRNSSVSQVAFKWGITHLGRFSADFKQLFGQLPKHAGNGNNGS